MDGVRGRTIWSLILVVRPAGQQQESMSTVFGLCLFFLPGLLRPPVLRRLEREANRSQLHGQHRVWEPQLDTNFNTGLVQAIGWMYPHLLLAQF